MRHYYRFAEDDRVKRRTIADALAVLRTLPGFGEQSRAKVRIGALALNSRDVVGLVDIEFNGPLPEVVCLVSLTTAARFHAIRGAAARREYFDIIRLDGATVDGAGTVTLADGTSLRAVGVIPANLPYEPSELGQRIIYNFVLMRGAEDRCFPSLRDRSPADIRYMVPEHVRVLDCHTLSQLEPPLLKVLAGYLTEHDNALETPSPQTIADTLAMFRVRPIRSRPRKKAP